MLRVCATLGELAVGASSPREFPGQPVRPMAPWPPPPEKAAVVPTAPSRLADEKEMTIILLLMEST